MVKGDVVQLCDREVCLLVKGQLSAFCRQLQVFDSLQGDN